MSIPSWEVFLFPQCAAMNPAGTWNNPAPSRNEDVITARPNVSIPRSVPIRGRAGAKLYQFNEYTVRDDMTEARTSHLLLGTTTDFASVTDGASSAVDNASEFFVGSGPPSLKIYFIQSQRTDPLGQRSHRTQHEEQIERLNKALPAPKRTENATCGQSHASSLRESRSQRNVYSARDEGSRNTCRCGRGYGATIQINATSNRIQGTGQS